MNYFSRDGVLIWYIYQRNYDILNKVLDFNIDIFFLHEENKDNLIYLTPRSNQFGS